MTKSREIGVAIDGSAYDRELVLEIEDLRTYLYTRWGTIKAVDGVNFKLHAGETLGIVGESGSGKSMLALSIVRMTPEPASRIEGGRVLLRGKDLLRQPESVMRTVRGREISMILQDPHQSLNPVYTIGNQLIEALHIHDRGADHDELVRRAVDSLRMVQVPAPEERLPAYPHEMSGGMKQRIVGAMAMGYEPAVLIADEPTTALDVTVQAQYLKLLKQLQKKTGVAILLITHDIGVIAAMCDRVAVMYAGRIVEQGPILEIFDNPKHPYTQGLLASLPRIDADVDELASIPGQPPSLTDLPSACYFAPRCSYVMEQCLRQYPDSFEVATDHDAACWLLDSVE